ncbi:MAG: hypothetical protein U5R49_21850 [Deltaproteobacteria bacterium]|nr:hypothetical protein [Deltaproteobacteria bacterium]
METIKMHVDIPDDRRLVLDLRVPASIPTGRTELVLVLHGQKKEEPQRSRELGAFRGKIRIAEDFDKPLEDAFWLGENHEISR